MWGLGGKEDVRDFRKVYACSGSGLTTTRPSSHPLWQKFPKPVTDVVTDWVLIRDLSHTQVNDMGMEEPFLNTLRIPGAETFDPSAIVITIGQVVPEAKVHTTGRTSGHRDGQVC
jgi:hypothetical protein